jgi:glycosyltransferase involved in cell wall biosynthesis
MNMGVDPSLGKSRVAVCIPTYNQARYLGGAVRSAFAQTYPGVEVWVSDDASTDDTPAVLERLAVEFPKLRWFRQPRNLNIAENTSWLLSRPDADFLVRLDSDDLLEPDYVGTLVRLLEAHPDAAYAHAAVRVIDENGRFVSVSRLRRATGYVCAERALRDAVVAYRVAANIVMFRATPLRELNFYRNRPDFVEDYDLAIRLADAGGANVYSEALLARYRVWNDSKSVRAKRKAMQLRGLTRIFTETLEPLFERRGWSLRPVRRSRLDFALRHAHGCFAKQFDAAERTELIPLLEHLAGRRSFRLRLRIKLLSLGFAPVFDQARRARKRCLALVKGVLSALRSARSLFPPTRDSARP